MVTAPLMGGEADDDQSKIGYSGNSDKDQDNIVDASLFSVRLLK